MARHITVVLGGYGCGKTEFSLNLALRCAGEGKRVALVDLDIVNPFFRSGFHPGLLRRAGVRLIVSPYTLWASDLPVVSSEVQAVFDGDFDEVIFDAGGDPVGATALGRYHRQFAGVEELEVLLLVNARRPMCESGEEVAELLGKLQSASRLCVTGLVNNTNLALETTPELLQEGDALLREVSARTGLPVRYHGILAQLCEACADMALAGEALPITPYTRLGWLDWPPANGEAEGGGALCSPAL